MRRGAGRTKQQSRVKTDAIKRGNGAFNGTQDDASVRHNGQGVERWLVEAGCLCKKGRILRKGQKR